MHRSVILCYNCCITIYGGVNLNNFDITEIIRNPVLTFSKKANEYYVYRHYYYNINGKEITFYVGKGQGMRALSENGRSELWNKRVETLNGDYFIDIVEFFDSEEKALDFEKQLISYYAINEFGCECNKVSKHDKIDAFLQNSNIQALESMMDANMKLIDVLKVFVGMHKSLAGRGLIDTMAQYMKFLKANNSKYEIRFKSGANLNDIESYVYTCLNI